MQKALVSFIAVMIWGITGFCWAAVFLVKSPSALVVLTLAFLACCATGLAIVMSRLALDWYE